MTRSDRPRRRSAATRSIRGRFCASIGEVAYEWPIDTDALIWGANAADVLGVADRGAIASGRGYAKLLDPDNGAAAASTR